MLFSYLKDEKLCSKNILIFYGEVWIPPPLFFTVSKISNV